jgi:hypothetical protein
LVSGWRGLLWLVNTYIPMDGEIKGILNAVVMIGVLDNLTNIHVGKLH